MSQSPKYPLGIYDHEDDVPGIESIEIPANKMTGFVRDAISFAESIDDLIPGAGDVWDWTKGVFS